MNAPLDAQQVAHICRVTLLGMCARAVGASEFDSSPEVRTLVITVDRAADGNEPVVQLAYCGEHEVVLGGMTI
jgi:hypothetical protein